MQVPAWRSLTLLAAALVGSYVITWPYLSESPRWLLAVGRRVRGSAPSAPSLHPAFPAYTIQQHHPCTCCTCCSDLLGCRGSMYPCHSLPVWLLSLPLTEGRPACLCGLCPCLSLRPSRLQGEATAVLAAIASTNRTHLPEVPLQEPAVGCSTLQQGLRELLSHSRLRKRLLIMLVVWCCCSQVREVQH